MRKPRLKQAGKEVTLQTYRLLQDKELLTPRVLEFMVHGVSTRNYEDLLDEVAGGLGLSKSTVSRAFSEGSKQALEEFQHRSLKDKKFAVIMVDGIYFASRNVVVAVGIDCLGFKFVLGLRDGNTESAAVCVDLFQDLIKRGLTAEKRFLFVIDGGQGVRAAIRRVFGDDFPVQRCFLHKARNIEEYLPEKEHREFRRRYKKMRSMDTYSQAHDEYKSLRKWLGSIHTSAMNSLDEAGEELLTVHRIGAGPVLRPTITNTNIIESVFSTVRYRSQRVKNWGDSPGKAARWTALCLLHAERSLQRIRGYFECREFIRKIEKIYLPSSPSVA